MVTAYQPLHHKYRPQRFDQLVGQEAIAATLSQALRSGRIAPAYLFSGPRGTGKTSSARILARSLNCTGAPGPTPEPCGVCALCEAIAAGSALDVIEIDAASNTGVDNIRDLIERSRFAPVQARWKVYVVDECHMLSTAAFNALLKTLEEPPPQVVFVLATTDPQRVLPTILSRCQRFDFRRIPLEALQGHLRFIADQEAIGISEEALHVVAQRAQGGLRDAESLLDQLSLLPPPIEPAAVWDLLGAVPEEELLALAGAMADAEPLVLVEACRLLLDRGREPSAVLQGLAGMLRDLLLAGVAPERLELTAVSPSLRPQLTPLARRIGKARLLHWQAQLKGSEQQLRLSVQPRLWLEVLLLGLLAEPLSSAGAGMAPPVASAAATPAPAVAATARPALTTTAAAAAPPPAATPGPSVSTAAAAPTQPPDSAQELSLPELWQQILAGLELPSTRMLLSQQAQLVRLDRQRAVVRVAGTWMAMVQSRSALLEAALVRALGTPRQLVLEAGGEGASASAPAAASSAAPWQPARPPLAGPAGNAAAASPARPAGEQRDPATSHDDGAPPAPQATGPAPAASATSADPGTSVATNTQPRPEALSTMPAQAAAAAGDAGPGSGAGHDGGSDAPRPSAAVDKGLPPAPEAAERNRAGTNAITAEAGPAPGPSGPMPAPIRPAAAGLPGSSLEDKARQLADFFNGEVIAEHAGLDPEDGSTATAEADPAATGSA